MKGRFPSENVGNLPHPLTISQPWHPDGANREVYGMESACPAVENAHHQSLFEFLPPRTAKA